MPGLWTGTAVSFIDLHPPGATDSRLYAMTSTQQAGVATIRGLEHAGIWAGTAASFVDLHSALSAHYSSSHALAIWNRGSTTVVGGYAYNAATNQNEAVLWTLTPMAPPQVTIAGKKKIKTTQTKRMIKGSATGVVTYVLARVGKGKWRPALGTAAWKFPAKHLKPGRNVIKVIARGPGGDSAPAKAIILRR